MTWLTPLQRTLISWLLLVAGGWALLLVLEFFKEFIFVFVIAGLIAFLLSYPVAYLQKYLPRVSAALLVYSFAGVVVAIFATVVAPTISEQASQLVRSLPVLIESGSRQVLSMQRWANRLGLPVDAERITEALVERVQEQLQVLTSPQSFEFVVGTFTGVLNFILILVIAFYMLLEGGRLWQGLIGFLPERVRDQFSEALQYNLRGFFNGQLILGLFMAGILIPVYLLLKVPFGLVLALFVGVMELIPFIGASLGIGVVVLISLIQEPLLGVWVLVASVIAQQIKDNVLAPRILGNFTGLSPVIIFGALLIGAKVAGLLGVILAIPISGVIKSVYEVLNTEQVPKKTVPVLSEPVLPRANQGNA